MNFLKTATQHWQWFVAALAALVFFGAWLSGVALFRNTPDGLETPFGTYRGTKETSTHPEDVATKTTKLDALVTHIPTSTSPWTGEWNRDADQFHGASVTITNVTPTNFTFDLSALSGANMGEVQGAADYTGAHAVFNGTSDDADPLSKKPCVVQFDLNARTSAISVQENSCGAYEGNSVSFEGNYIKDGKGKEVSITASDIFQSDSSRAEFLKLVGSYHGVFDDSCQFFDSSEDLDYIGANVQTCFVQGLGGIAGSIIMIAPENKIWAAVFDDDGTNSGNVIVRYFTNANGWEGHLPKTIEAWDNKSGDNKVIYMNASQ